MEFKASNGWFNRLKKKYKISLVATSGESASANKSGAEKFKETINNLTQGYSDEEIFNIDETGLFWRAMPDKTLTRSGKSVQGWKKNKERLTVLFLVNKAGEKYEPVIIGKSKSPRRVTTTNLHHLGVSYTSNTSAWVTKTFFYNYLNSLNNTLQEKNKKMLLLLDNCSCHMLDNFSNIKLLFLPPNTTSLIQPLDRGIIRCFKSYYKKHFMNSVMSKSIIDFNTKFKSYKIYEAIQNISLAWKQVSKQTVQNCFKPLFEMAISNEVEDILIEQKDELDVLIRNMKDLQLIEEEITSENFLEIDSKKMILKDIIPQEILNSKIKTYLPNVNKFSELKKKDIKRMKSLMSEIKRLNEKITPELSLNLIEFENIFNEHLNKKSDLHQP